MSAHALALLTRPARPLVVLRYAGILVSTFALMASAPLIASILLGDGAAAGRYGIVAVASLAAGTWARRLNAPEDVRAHEALAVVALMFVLGSIAMAWPFAAHGVDAVDALFESVSALTTTGLSTLPTPEALPASLVFARSWLQWYGGLAIIVLAVGLAIGPGAAAKRLWPADESLGELVAGTQRRARSLFTVYCLLTTVGFAALWAAGASPFDAFVHVLSSVSTGGFSSSGDSAAGAGGFAFQVTLSVLFLLGATSFGLQLRVWRRKPWSLFKDEEFRTLLKLGLWAAAVLAAAMAASGKWTWSQIAWAAPFTAFSAQSTTGFTVVSIASLSALSKLVLIFSMLIGGDMGSTAGGIKIFRLLVVRRLIAMSFRYAALAPHAVAEMKISGRKVETREIEGAAAIVGLFLTITAVSWVPFLAYGYDPLDSLFEVASAVGTVGLSSGVSSPNLPGPLKLVLCFDMLAGRLEVLAFLTLLNPYTWIGRRE